MLQIILKPIDPLFHFDQVAMSLILSTLVFRDQTIFRLSLILGWGKENNEQFDKGDLSYCGAYSCGLKKAYVPITPLAECKQQHKFAFQIFSSMHICAGAEGIVLFVKCYSIRLTSNDVRIDHQPVKMLNFTGRDTCSGDSGGPLLVKSDRHSPTFLLGVVSFGINKCGTGVPGVYTNVQSFMPWIRSKE